MHSNQRCIIKVRASPVRGIGLPWSSVRFPSPSGRGVELPCPNSASFARPRAQILKPVKKKKIKREIKILQNLSGGPNVVQARARFFSSFPPRRAPSPFLFIPCPVASLPLAPTPHRISFFALPNFALLRSCWTWSESPSPRPPRASSNT